MTNSPTPVDRPTTSSVRSLTLALAGLAGLAGLTGGLIGAATLAPAPSVVAWVDLGKLFKDSNLNVNSGMRLAEIEERFKESITELEKKVKDKQDEFALYPTDSQRWAQAQQEIQTLVSQLRAEQAFANEKMAREKATTIDSTYQEVRAAIKAYAESNGIDFVLMNDSTLDLLRTDPQRMLDQIAQRRLMHANANLDITEPVLSALNKKHPLLPGATAPTTASQPTNATGTP